MEEKYINFILNRCIYPKSNSLFILYYKDNKDFIDKLIKRASTDGYENILTIEQDIELEHQLLMELTSDEIINHPYFNNPIWQKAAEEKYVLLNADSNYPNYFDDIPNSKILAVNKVKGLVRKRYNERIAEDSISWTIFALPNSYWAKRLFPDSDDAYKKLEEMIYSFSMIDNNYSENSFDNYLRIENKKINYLNNLDIKELKLTSDLGTNLTMGLVDNYIFRALEQNHCVENLPTYSVWSMPHKYQTNGIVMGSLPITHRRANVVDYWFQFKDGKVIDYDAKIGKEYLDDYFSKGEDHKRLGEIAIIDSNSPIAKTNKVYNFNLFDENISTHLALGMAYKNTIKNGTIMSNEELDKNGCNVCSDHLDFTIGINSLNIVAVTKNNEEVEIYRNGKFNYELIGEECPFI